MRRAWLLLALFAALGLAVAATGLYGVLSYSVTERRREIGVRAALGATRGRLVGLVLRQGLAFTVAGLALGLVASAGASQFLSSLLFGVTPYDTVAFAIAPCPTATASRTLLTQAAQVRSRSAEAVLRAARTRSL